MANKVVCVILVENANSSYILPLNLHDHLEPLEFSPKILTQTVQVPKLLDVQQMDRQTNRRECDLNSEAIRIRE